MADTIPLLDEKSLPFPDLSVILTEKRSEDLSDTIDRVISCPFESMKVFL